MIYLSFMFKKNLVKIYYKILISQYIQLNNLAIYDDNFMSIVNTDVYSDAL